MSPRPCCGFGISQDILGWYSPSALRETSVLLRCVLWNYKSHCRLMYRTAVASRKTLARFSSAKNNIIFRFLEQRPNLGGIRKSRPSTIGGLELFKISRRPAFESHEGDAFSRRAPVVVLSCCGFVENPGSTFYPPQKARQSHL